MHLFLGVGFTIDVEMYSSYKLSCIYGSLIRWFVGATLVISTWRLIISVLIGSSRGDAYLGSGF